MKVLIADDDRVARAMLEAAVRKHGFEPVMAANGIEAWTMLCAPDGPRVALLDWMMPGADGLDICRRVRALPPERYIYIVFLTGRSSREDQLTGFAAGADDFIAKPYDPREVGARLRIGERLVRLQEDVARRSRELAMAEARIANLEGLLPICMHCKRIRDEDRSWQPLEQYIQRHSRALFTHSLCEICLERHFPE
jgi:DNA-binding response OmpR family regulator